MNPLLTLLFLFLISCTPIIQTTIPIKVAKNTCQVTEVRSSGLTTVAYLTCNLDGRIIFPVLTSGSSQVAVGGKILQAGAIVGAGALISGIGTGTEISVPGLP